jgi:hypothetical protein
VPTFLRRVFDYRKCGRGAAYLLCLLKRQSSRFTNDFYPKYFVGKQVQKLFTVDVEDGPFCALMRKV